MENTKCGMKLQNDLKLMFLASSLVKFPPRSKHYLDIISSCSGRSGEFSTEVMLFAVELRLSYAGQANAFRKYVKVNLPYAASAIGGIATVFVVT